MRNRLPPAWSKHLKAPQKASSPIVAMPSSPLPKAGLNKRSGDEELLKEALELQQANRLPEAEEVCHRVLARTREHPLALYILGTLGVDFNPDLAISYFQRAVAGDPRNPYFHFGLGDAFSRVDNNSSAAWHFQRAYELKPDFLDAQQNLAQAYANLGKAEAAVDIYERLLAIRRDRPNLRLDMARALSSIGRMDDAAAYLNENISERVDLAESYKKLVGTRKYSGESSELASILRELEEPGLSAEDAHELHMAAGKVLNDLRHYERAMDHFLKANKLKEDAFDIERYRKRVDALIALFDPSLLAAKKGYGHTSDVPVFVLGMPRSGTTLTEQICASHPQVRGAGELTKLRRIGVACGLVSKVEPTFGEPVRTLTPEGARSLAGDYLSDLALYAADASRIVDKMPHNFELVGLIAILFPNARIIHCRRDAIDNCISCFTTDLQKAHGYANDLTKLGLYYRQYDRLMRHWHSLLPGQIFENRYEDLIADQEGRSRRLIDHLGLTWDDACLRFFDRDASIRTASVWQARQPIYASSVKRWKNYGEGIKPLIDALGDLAEA